MVFSNRGNYFAFIYTRGLTKKVFLRVELTILTSCYDELPGFLSITVVYVIENGVILCEKTRILPLKVRPKFLDQ